MHRAVILVTPGPWWDPSQSQTGINHEHSNPSDGMTDRPDGLTLTPAESATVKTKSTASRNVLLPHGERIHLRRLRIATSNLNPFVQDFSTTWYKSTFKGTRDYLLAAQLLGRSSDTLDLIYSSQLSTIIIDNLFKSPTAKRLVHFEFKPRKHSLL